MKKQQLSIEDALNKKQFAPVSAMGLKYLVANCPVKRKPSEADCPYISYLPSFIQMVEDRLRAVCGMEIVSHSLSDGTGRKSYDIRQCIYDELKKPDKG